MDGLTTDKIIIQPARTQTRENGVETQDANAQSQEPQKSNFEKWASLLDYRNKSEVVHFFGEFTKKPQRTEPKINAIKNIMYYIFD